MTTDQKTGESVRDRPCRACAHCGSEATFPYLTDTGVAWYVNCNHCGARSAAHQHQWQAIAAWNRRAERNAGERWVDASERKPDTGTCPTVLCCSPCWDRPQALIWTGLKWLWDFDGNECSAPVTHWMQMPALLTTAARREG